jgi:hypothetical protein
MTPTKLRKNPVKRLFPGLAGRYEPEAAPAPASPAEPPDEPTPELQRGRPGRPAKYADAATKQAAYRARKEENLADAERRNLVAELMRIYRRMQSHIIEMKTGSKKGKQQARERADKLRVENRQRLGKLHDDLLTLPVASIKNVLATWKETPDTRGRLRNERSGEDKSKYGMSELERIIAGQDRNENGTRVSPEGHGVDSSEQDDDSDSSNTRPPRGQRMPPEHIAYLDDREEIITELIKQHVRKISLDEDQPAHRCLLCGAKLPEFSEARQHFWTEYDKGLKLYYHYQELSEDSGVAEMAQFMVNEARRAYQNHKHLQEVWRVSRERQAEERKARKGIS